MHFSLLTTPTVVALGFVTYNSYLTELSGEQPPVYELVPRSRIIEVLRHLRELWRQAEPTDQRERFAAEQREVVAKYLISNLPRTGEHPTLKSLMEVAETFLLTIGATHQLFGYDLEAVRQQDLLWNTGRTHIERPHERLSAGKVHRALSVGNGSERNSNQGRRYCPCRLGEFSLRQLKYSGQAIRS